VRSALLVVISTTALAVLAMSCGGSPVASPVASMMVAPSQPIGLDGRWSGTGIDSQGATIVTWSLTQTGTSASGTVKTEAVNPTDGSCNSCHRNKTGTFMGTLSGTTLTMTMFFAAGGDGDPTPACNAMVTATSSHAGADTVSAAYSGADSCEGPFTNGTLMMKRDP